jgi:hypothetical protein
MFRSEPPAPPPPPEPAPEPPKHPLDSLVRSRVLLAYKPDGERAIEGRMMAAVLDGHAPGYWLFGSTIDKIILHETTEQGAVDQTAIIGQVWVDRADVLYLRTIPLPQRDLP